MAEVAGAARVAGRALTPRQVRGSRPGYAVLRAAGAVLAALVVGGSALSLAPEMAHQEQTTVAALDAGQVQALEAGGVVRVEGVRGDVRVREADGEEPRVVSDAQWSFTEPTLTVRTDPDGQVVVSAPCSTHVLERCQADLEVVVPVGTDFDIRSTFGDIAVGSTGQVTVQATGGHVTLDGAPVRATVRTTFGDVSVGASQPPELVDVTTTFGSVRVSLPRGQAYAVTAETTQGTREVTVPEDTAAPHTVRVRSTFGDVRVTP